MNDYCKLAEQRILRLPLKFVPAEEFGFKCKGTLIHETANIVGQVEIGDQCRIDAFTTISGKVKIGRYVHIGTGACIFGDVTMEDYSSLSPGVKVFSATEDINWGLTNPCAPEAFRKPLRGSVYIGKHATVGANSVILPGVDMGTGSVLGALSVLKRGIPAWAVWAGTPARQIRVRNKIPMEFEC